MLKEFLKQNQKIIEAHVDAGSEPIFNYPPIIYSPPADPLASLTSSIPENRFSFLRKVVKHVFTQNELTSSI